MLKIIFALTAYEQDHIEQVSAESRGHITISGSLGTVTSEGKFPDQSTMIFYSIGDLLDGIRSLWLDSTKQHYHFTGIGCSFELYFVKAKWSKYSKKKSDYIVVEYGGKAIDEVHSSELVQALWSAVKEFSGSLGNHFPSGSSGATYFRSSVQEFSQAFALPHVYL